MKNQIALAVSLSLVGSVMSIGSAEAAGLFNDGDRIVGSSGATGIYGQAIDPDNDQNGVGDETGPALNYFGTIITGGSGLFIDGPGFTGFNYAEITNPALAPLEAADTFVGVEATGGFTTLAGTTALIRSIQSGYDPNNPGGDPAFGAPTIVDNFLVMTDGAGLTVTVDLNGQIQSETTVPGGGFVFEIPVIVIGEQNGDAQVVDGIFRFSAQDISEAFDVDPTVIDPSSNGEVAYTLGDGAFTGPVSYSWEIDVIKPVPEPSSLVSLLGLAALGGGMAMKRRVSK